MQLTTNKIKCKRKNFYKNYILKFVSRCKRCRMDPNSPASVNQLQADVGQQCGRANSDQPNQIDEANTCRDQKLRGIVAISSPRGPQRRVRLL